MNNKVVVALGRNAFGRTFPEQKEMVKQAAKAIADLAEARYEVVITHSNGPQIGLIQTAMTEYSRISASHTVAPMSVCGAMSQGYIGYDLQNAIRSELLNRGIYKPVSTIITQVRVDPFDRAFHNPTKIIGRVMSRDEAESEERKGNYVTFDSRPQYNGYRRIVASPMPIDIYEIDAIRTLVDAGQLVIAAGGGGIPVLDQRTQLKGASAIIEKDFTAAKLADMLDASYLLILTAGDYLTYTDSDGNEQNVGEISVNEAEKLIAEGHFGPTTTLPKVQASLNFVTAGSGRTAIITDLGRARDGIEGRVGTVIR
ncbi:MAG: carbamate kinase [Lachnospiraceae bacterium]|nr:carbamate kinase [Lachnospiraceae bacterium]